jgi:hypothetical protein
MSTGTPDPNAPQWETAPSAPDSARPSTSDGPSDASSTDAAAPPDPAAVEQQRAALEQEYKAALEDMQSKLADLESRVASGQLTAAPVDAQLKEKVGELRQAFADWPAKGGQLENVPQTEDGKPAHPWDLGELGLPVPGVTRDFLPPGPNELSPIVVAHNHPILIPGTAGTDVQELGRLLGEAGYPNSISRGTNHAFAFDDSVTAAVSTFRRDFHVQDDPSGFPADHRAEIYVGPWTWEALERVAARGEKQAA